MGTQTMMTDVERAAIAEEITGLYNKSMEASNNVDVSNWPSILDDSYNLGFIDGGEFFSSAKDITEAFREGF